MTLEVTEQSGETQGEGMKSRSTPMERADSLRTVLDFSIWPEKENQ